MFNIKSIVKQITERSRDSNAESPSRAAEDPGLQKTEGFLCPKCMKQLPTPWELQTHYETVHEEDMPSEFNMQSISGVMDAAVTPEDEADLIAAEQDVSVCGDIVNSSLAVEDVPFITDVVDLQEKLQQALSRKAILETRVVRLVQSNVTLKTAVDDMDRDLSQLRERHKILEAQLQHRESIDDAAVLRQELVQVQRVMDEMNREREKERDDLQVKLIQLQEKNQSDTLIETLKSSLSIKEKECKQLTEDLENLRIKYDSAVNKLANEEKCKVCSCDTGIALETAVCSPNVAKLQGALVHGHYEDTSNEKQIQVKMEPDAETLKALEAKTLELTNLTRNHDELKKEMMHKSEQWTRIQHELESTKQNTSAQNKKLEEQQNQLSDMLSKEKKICANLKMEIGMLSAEKLDVEMELQNSLEECTTTQSITTDLKHSLAELHQEYQHVQSEHEQQRQQLRKTIQEKCELLQKQEDAVQLLVSERAELARQIETIETNKLHDAEEAAQKLEKFQSELAEQVKKQKHLEDCLLSETQKSHSLQENLNKLNESSNAVLESINEEMKTLKSSLDEISGEKLALEAQLEATGCEQQKLLERCYTSTSEIENLQHTISELRRKWEESESALQELGRENATLQLDIEKLLARKWAEDADVAQCTLCHREFTMLLRKHHCRNCGQIFCNECSSKTAAVVSNKKPVRVCDSCYTELRTN